MFGSFANQAEHDEIRLAIWKLKRKLKETANADTVGIGSSYLEPMAISRLASRSHQSANSAPLMAESAVCFKLDIIQWILSIGY